MTELVTSEGCRTLPLLSQAFGDTHVYLQRLYRSHYVPHDHIRHLWWSHQLDQYALLYDDHVCIACIPASANQSWLLLSDGKDLMQLPCIMHLWELALNYIAQCCRQCLQCVWNFIFGSGVLSTLSSLPYCCSLVQLALELYFTH